MFISLSASKLNLLGECARCFWLANQDKAVRVERPRGIFPSLPGGMDLILKTYADLHRGSLPPELVGKVPGVLWGSLEQIKRLRHWKSGLQAKLQIGSITVGLIGALDDLLVTPEGAFAPFDWKTKGSAPKDDGAQYYQTQQDIYALLLRHNDMPPTGKGYLSYWYPAEVLTDFAPPDPGLGIPVRFGVAVYELSADADRASELIERAVSIITGPMPSEDAGCEYCAYVGQVGAQVVRPVGAGQGDLQLQA